MPKASFVVFLVRTLLPSLRRILLVTPTLWRCATGCRGNCLADHFRIHCTLLRAPTSRLLYLTPLCLCGSVRHSIYSSGNVANLVCRRRISALAIIHILILMLYDIFFIFVPILKTSLGALVEWFSCATAALILKRAGRFSCSRPFVKYSTLPWCPWSWTIL